jgi:hypothetical protein
VLLVSRQLPKPHYFTILGSFTAGPRQVFACSRLYHLFLRGGDGRGCRVVEFLNSYCVYGWDVNYNVQDTPRSTNCSHWALVYRKEIGR